MLKRFLSAALLLVASIAFFPQAASAYFGELKIENPSSKYVWITIYTGGDLTRYSIEGTGCLKPGQNWTWKGRVDSSENQLKVRAEVKTGDCKSHNLPNSDTYDVARIITNGGPYQVFHADIYNHGNRHFIAYR